MNILIADAAVSMKPKAVESMQELMRALQDSVEHHLEASERIENDDFVSDSLREIAEDRKRICANIGEVISMADEKPVEDGTFMGKLRTIWTAFRAGLNAGDATVVLIEAEKAEDVILKKFKSILPEIENKPINVMLNDYCAKLKLDTIAFSRCETPIKPTNCATARRAPRF